MSRLRRRRTLESRRVALTVSERLDLTVGPGQRSAMGADAIAVLASLYREHRDELPPDCWAARRFPQ